MEVYNFSGRLLADYNEYMDSNTDPDTRHWLLVNSFLPLASIISGYLAFCTYIGPMLMRRRQPFHLKHTLIAYNLVNVAASVWLVSESLQSGWLGDYNFRCQPIDYSGSPKAARMRRACWVYFMCKLVELLETVFFVLRKKDKQVSHLHLYHHSIMPTVAWVGLRFAPGGQASLGMLLNCVVHTVMYTYYLLAALGPQYHKYLWWKKHLTALQLVQFVVVVGHLSQVLLFDCDYPKLYAVFVGINVVYICYLFACFYVQSYTSKTAAKKTA